MARLMGLDLGEKRIGVAVTDPDQTIAFPERVLARRSAKADRQALASLVRELAVDRVVIGLPLSMEGQLGPNAQRAKSFGEYLARVLTVPIEYQDERLTTVEAEERLRESGQPALQRKSRIDAAAAAVILEDYMRAHPA
jgi:putative Holliday junction resolvase